MYVFFGAVDDLTPRSPDQTVEKSLFGSAISHLKCHFSELHNSIIHRVKNFDHE